MSGAKREPVCKIWLLCPQYRRFSCEGHCRTTDELGHAPFCSDTPPSPIPQNYKWGTGVLSFPHSDIFSGLPAVAPSSAVALPQYYKHRPPKFQTVPQSSTPSPKLPICNFGVPAYPHLFFFLPSGLPSTQPTFFHTQTQVITPSPKIPHPAPKLPHRPPEFHTVPQSSTPCDKNSTPSPRIPHRPPKFHTVPKYSYCNFGVPADPNLVFFCLQARPGL